MLHRVTGRWTGRIRVVLIAVCHYDTLALIWRTNVARCRLRVTDRWTMTVLGHEHVLFNGERRHRSSLSYRTGFLWDWWIAGYDGTGVTRRCHLSQEAFVNPLFNGKWLNRSTVSYRTAFVTRGNSTEFR